jgi:glycosyltransferase involved in cell wall biosynthesis
MTNVSEMPLKVMHCIHSLVGGGAESQLRMLVNASSHHDMVPAIFCVNRRGDHLLANDVAIYESQQTHKYDFSIFRALYNAILDFKPNVIHAWLPASMTIPAMVLSRKFGIPCVSSYRSAMFVRRPLAIAEFLCALFCSAGIISNNPVNNSSKMYRFLYQIKHGIKIANAVSIAPNLAMPARRSCQSKRPSILFAGRITRVKNWDCLVRSLPIVLAHRDIELKICGQGEEMVLLLEAIQREGIQSHVQVLGYRDDLHVLMSQADMLVLPSWHEGMSNVFLEALSIGLPCVVSDIPANREVIGSSECALIFDPRSSRDLAERIIWVLDNPDHVIEMVKRGLNVAGARSPSNLAAECKKYYTNICVT